MLRSEKHKLPHQATSRANHPLQKRHSTTPHHPKNFLSSFDSSYIPTTRPLMHINKSVASFVAAMLLSSGAADSRFQFMSANGQALSSLTGKLYNSGDMNTIYSQPKAPWEKGVQLFYRQLSQEDASTPLVTVSVVNTDTNQEFEVQRGFNIITQSCSCYWLDAADLSQRLPGLTSGKYVLQFKSDPATEAGRPAVYERSGTFAITKGASPDTAPTGITSATVDPYDMYRVASREMDDKEKPKSDGQRAVQVGGVTWAMMTAVALIFA